MRVLPVVLQATNVGVRRPGYTTILQQHALLTLVKVCCFVRQKTLPWGDVINGR